MNRSEYRRVPKKDCIRVIDLAIAAQAAGEALGDDVSLAEATDALVTTYCGNEMLFDGTCPALLAPFCEDPPGGPANLSIKMTDAVIGLYNIRWWNPSDLLQDDDHYHKRINLMLLRSEADAVWDGMCEILFKGRHPDLWTFAAIEISGLDSQETGEDATSTDNCYSTPLLMIMNAAIAEFFMPRCDKDAKREEVVKWIKTQMSAAKMPDSENIAAAIFTIIKPIDHDPRKRRG